jgi:16S rRNA (uracil1498-N3)-methyltransferase
MHVFYAEDVSGSQLVLSREESTHAVKVLRLAPGNVAEVIDGRGHRYRASFEGLRQKQCFFHVLNTEKVDRRPVRLTMAVAPTKQIDRFEWFLEKATELGVERIVPIITQHSERKVVKTDRAVKILIAAMKQSRTAWLPEITETIDFNSFIQDIETPENGFIAHCHSGELPHLFHQSIRQSLTILIGPEGDFSLEEVNKAKLAGLKEISLSENRLRTETAAIAAVHIVALRNI